jgi:hypothetical protein
MFELNVVVTIYSKDNSFGKTGIFRRQIKRECIIVPRKGDLYEFSEDCLETVSRIAILLNNEIWVFIDLDRLSWDREDLEDIPKLFELERWEEY